tara:strand:- start:887 stop:1432 length:546 start_codon:yes stop_codon:yes gene_type:complete
MKKYIISKETLKKAEARAETLPLLKNSIRRGKGAIVAYLGEAVVKRVLSGEIEDTYDYDIVYGDGIKVDVKTKERTRVPELPWYLDWNCTVADFNIKQKCDEYAFVSVLNDYSAAWFLGKISKEEFYKKAKFYKAGELDPSSPPSKPWNFKADCYNVTVEELISISNLENLTEPSYEGGHY